MVVQMSRWSQMTEQNNLRNLYSYDVEISLFIWPLQVPKVQYIVAVGSDSCRLTQYIEL